MNKMLE